ncbi:hypothetical protein MN116_003572 [Schistosoma mekongi]|uniref:Nuclear protein MDM1 n=1 Tax=Schistosoma mekongi TaxID=38744 RepID=A0AAE1ZE15_SCHME|nr:hypothetical protein MN116_003572 [Schistosoma mekongi]
MGKITEEPLFQKKRKFELTNEFNLNKQFSNSKKEDDYFVIGPSDGKFSNSIAYRNKMKRNARSVSPQKKQKISDISSKHQPSTQINKCSRKSSPNLKLHRDEAVQTDTAHKALEAEIRRIREEIENRKQILRTKEGTKENKKYVKIESDTVQKLNKKNSKSIECSDPVVTSVPEAPRQHKSNKTPLREYSENWKSEPPKATVYTWEKARISEYQSAFKAPQFNNKFDTTRPIRPFTCKLDKFQSRKTPYDTEYRHEYKPFKYVPVDQLKSTDIAEEKYINIIPVKRPSSAYGIREIVKNNIDNADKKRFRALTPPTQAHSKLIQNRKKYTTEYSAKYRDYSDALGNSQNQMKLANKSLPYDWYQEIIKLREEADAYRKRDRESHFSREHLAQLESDYVSYWDPPSNDNYVESIEKYKEALRMPRAGKPSTELVTDLNDVVLLPSQRRRAMLDSHHVAEIMDQDDCSDIDYDQNIEENNDHLSTQIYPGYKTDMKYTRDNYVGMLPSAKKYNYTDEIYDNYKSENDSLPVTNSERELRTNNTHAKQWSDESKYHPSNKQNHWIHNKYEQKQRTIDDTESLTSCSSLSEKSMELSARLAHETLERAQKQHERMLQEQKYYNENKYSPNAYSECESMQYEQ